MIPNIYPPPFRWSHVKPTASVDEIREHQAELKKIMWNHLRYLAVPDPQKKEKKAERCACKITPCHDNSVCNLSFYIFNKLGRIFMDAFCCCCDGKPTKKAWVSKDMYERFKLSRQSFHRNLCGLCCIAPAAIISTPFITQPVALKVMTIVSGMVTLEFAGTMTYVFSGDVAILLDKIRRILYLVGGYRASTGATEGAIHNKLAEFLEKGWKESSMPEDLGEWQDAEEPLTEWNPDMVPANKAQIWKICKGIISCWNEIEEGFREVGVAEDMIGQILDHLGTVLSNIKVERAGHDFPQFEALDPPPILIPIMGEPRPKELDV